jgi:TRAP-type C4-dicarboxylate transport system substrate-binding protein
LCGAIAGVFVLSAQPATAAEPITLKLADSLPATHYISVEAAQYFMDRATELSGEKIKFEYYPAQQLGKTKDLLRLTQSGVTDIGYLPVGSMPDQLPLSGVGGLPGLYNSACQGSYGISELTREGFLAEAEYKPAGVRVLFGIALVPYKALTSEKKIDSLDDISGVKLRTSSSAQDETVRALGGVPVRIPAPELYQAMTRGTVDGFLLPFASAKSYDLHTTETTKYAFTGISFGSATAVWTISESKWNQLPADVQKALLEAGQQAEKHFCEYLDAGEANFRKLIEEGGVEVSSVSGAAVTDWQNKFAGIKADWAGKLDAAGKPGSKTLEAAQKAFDR